MNIHVSISYIDKFDFQKAQKSLKFIGKSLSGDIKDVTTEL